MSRLIVLTGASGTGKTTWAVSWAAEGNDRRRLTLGGRIGKRAAAALRAELVLLLAMGHSVVLDLDGGAYVPSSALHGMNYEVRHFGAIA